MSKRTHRCTPRGTCLEADQERNDRVTHYTHYGEQIQTIRTSQYLRLQTKVFLVLEGRFLVAYAHLYKSVGRSVSWSISRSVGRWFFVYSLDFQEIHFGLFSLSLFLSLSLSLTHSLLVSICFY